jgi:hypothetical protein
MNVRFFVLLLGSVLLLAAADKRIVGSARGENQDVILQVTLYLDRASVMDLIGNDLQGNFIVAAVKVEPKYGKEIAIDLVVPHQRVGGNEGSILYGGVAPQVNGAAQAKDTGTPADAALEKVLEEKVLPEKKTDQPVSGLLYFSMDKQKMKDLELTYGGRGENRIALRFKPQ